jgi:hypothetical protein
MGHLGRNDWLSALLNSGDFFQLEFAQSESIPDICYLDASTCASLPASYGFNMRPSADLVRRIYMLTPNTGGGGPPRPYHAHAVRRVCCSAPSASAPSPLVHPPVLASSNASDETHIWLESPSLDERTMVTAHAWMISSLTLHTNFLMKNVRSKL